MTLNLTKRELDLLNCAIFLAIEFHDSSIDCCTSTRSDGRVISEPGYAGQIRRHKRSIERLKALKSRISEQCRGVAERMVS